MAGWAGWLTTAARMRFWQRCLVLGSICFLLGTLYYHTLLDSDFQGTEKIRTQQRALEGRLGETEITVKISNLS
jgi:hypothetical protein